MKPLRKGPKGATPGRVEPAGRSGSKWVGTIVHRLNVRKSFGERMAVRVESAVVRS